MKNVIALVMFACVSGSVLLSTERAEAIKPFSDEFIKMYVKKDSTDAGDVALVKAVEEVKCNVCHVGKNKKDRNEYGKALDKLLDKKTDAKDLPKIQDALKKVADMHSKPDDATSPTFGDLFKQGKLATE